MEQEESSIREGIYNLPFEEWSTWCESQKSTDKFFGKMKRGIVEDNCQNDMRAFFENDNILGVIATKHLKTYANLKWIVTSPEARGKGVFRALCEDSVRRAYGLRLKHYRVSINPPALEAYQRVGFKTWGIQQSDCYLSIGRLGGPNVSDLIWEWDAYTEKEVTKQGRGGCVKEYWKEPRGL
jgi:GNAT superfamily N-acetyltransferase